MNKYRAVKTWVGDIRFDSRREAERYKVLKLLEKAGKIRGLELQPKFPLLVKGERVGTYTADFEYLEEDGGEWLTVIEDCKGVRIREYRRTAKHIKAQYGITIRET